MESQARTQLPWSDRCLTGKVNDDGSTKIDGETGITTSAQGQTTNLGGDAGIIIMPSAPDLTKGPKNATTPATTNGSKNSMTSADALTGQASGSMKNSTSSGADGLTALIGALQDASSGSTKKNGTAAATSAPAENAAVPVAEA